jgi:hypothetical protein
MEAPAWHCGNNLTKNVTIRQRCPKTVDACLYRTETVRAASQISDVLQGIEKQGLEDIFGCMGDVGTKYAVSSAARRRSERQSQ